MTSRSSRLFWVLTGILALIIAIPTAIISYRSWRLDSTMNALDGHHVYTTFRYRGPDWLEPLLPEL